MNKLYQSISEVTAHFFNLGWSERNAGNISFRLTTPEIFPFEKVLDNPYGFYSEQELMVMISITGSRFREMSQYPITFFGMLHCQHDQIRWYSSLEEQMPSSEWISHLRIHHYLATHHPERTMILHTHPTELIAFSHVTISESKERMNAILWDMMPEVRFFIPEGLGVVPLLMPGSDELALETIEQLKDHTLILWKKHGVLASGKDIWEIAEYLEIANKAAKIYLLSK